MRQCHGLAAPERGAPLIPFAFARRDLGADDIAVAITHCGICHSDLHAVRGGGPFPLVPGHEIAGVVTGLARVGMRYRLVIDMATLTQGV